MLVSSLMLIYWMMLLSIQLVALTVLEVLYWRTLHSTQPQWLTTMALLVVPRLVLSVMKAVDMN